jgi:hypothetical protein
VRGDITRVATQLNCVLMEHPDLLRAVIRQAYRHEHATTQLLISGWPYDLLRNLLAYRKLDRITNLINKGIVSYTRWDPVYTGLVPSHIQQLW